MTGPGQLALPFPPRRAFAGGDFLVAAPNRAAVAWLERWPEWPGPVLALYGPAGCGKTHLLHVFVERCGGRVLATDDFDGRPPAQLLGEARAAAVDDAEAALARHGDEPFLHLLNWIREAGASVLMAARRPPARWAVGLADLRSRLNAAPAVGIGAPDDTLLKAVLLKHFDDRRLPVDDAVLGFLLTRMERSFAAAARLAAELDEASLRARRPVTIPFARRLLGEAGGGGD